MRWKKERKKEIIVLTNTFLRMKREAIQAGLKPTLETKESFLLHIYPNRVQPAYNPSKHTRLKEKRKGELANMKIEREWWEGEWGNIYISISHLHLQEYSNGIFFPSSPTYKSYLSVFMEAWVLRESWGGGGELEDGFVSGDQDFGNLVTFLSFPRFCPSTKERRPVNPSHLVDLFRVNWD